MQEVAVFAKIRHIIRWSQDRVLPSGSYRALLGLVINNVNDKFDATTAPSQCSSAFWKTRAMLSSRLDSSDDSVEASGENEYYRSLPVVSYCPFTVHSAGFWGDFEDYRDICDNPLSYGGRM